jgi:hypothetical protein
VQTVAVDRVAVRRQWQRQSDGSGNSGLAAVTSGGGQRGSSSGSGRRLRQWQVEQQERVEYVEEIVAMMTATT